ncbi:MAG: RNA polymerase sigma factor [Clostridia bacterium]|nr:RNA polymerase sigma factor [Clostridia bacterium]
MQDENIVELYWLRSETAIRETEQKYGPYLSKIAYNILNNIDDSRESVNDTYLKAWNSMPPQKPSVLKTYLGKITRQLSIDIFRTRNRKKRGMSQYAVSLSELEECIPSNHSVEREIELQFLGKTINEFLYTLSEQSRHIFVCRYYFCDSIKDISAFFAMSESKVKSILHRTRLSLKNHLESEGFFV